MKRDRAVIFLIMGLAVAATVFAGWFRWNQGHIAQEFWGVEVAQRIRFAPRVELLWLESPQLSPEVSGLAANGSPGQTGNSITIDGLDWPIRNRTDITQARGLVHARQALLQDATFLWDPPNRDSHSSWTHALVIGDPDEEPVILLFDLAAANEGFVREQNASETIQLTIPQGFETFFSEQIDHGIRTGPAETPAARPH